MQECFLGKLEEGARSCWFGGGRGLKEEGRGREDGGGVVVEV